MTHEEQNIGGGAEHHSEEEQKISRMLFGLKRVEAPKDFDFKVKARIANTRPEDLRPASLFPILKYTLPLGLLLFVGAGIILNSSYSNWRAFDVVVSSSPDPSPVLPETDIIGTDRRPESVVSDTRDDSTRAPDSGSLDPAPRRVTPKRTGELVVTPRLPVSQPDRSGDFTARVAPTPINPPGIDPSVPANVTVAPVEMAPKTVGIRDGLRTIGVEVKLDGNILVVTSVMSSQIADQMGIRPGDRLEAIDGNPVDDKTVLEGSFRVSTIRVKRGTETIDLTLGKKPI